VRILGYPPRPRSPRERQRREEEEEEGRRRKEFEFFGGRRGSRLRLGADFGVPSTPEEPARAPAERGGRGGRKKEEGI
jgi:hypothetical protein